MADKDKLKALELAVGQIEKQFGKGSIMRLGREEVPAGIPAISTGSLGLDIALGVGGVPRGRIIEIYGPESSGKTTLALHIIAEAQKAGGQAAFIDAEHALDVTYARKLGVRTDDLLISQPDTGEQALEITETLVRSGAIDVIVVDSVAALTPRAEIEGEMGDAHMGLQARLMSQALRKLTGAISKSATTLIFINQIRMKIGVMFGNPETTTGGNALKFYASVRLDIRKIAAIKEGEEVTGGRVRVKVVKNKIAPPFRSAEFDIMFNEGVSKIGEIIDMGVEKNIVEKSGAWFSYNGTRIGQGRENVKLFLRDHPEMASEIEIKVRQAAGLTGSGVSAPGGRGGTGEGQLNRPWRKPAKASKGKSNGRGSMNLNELLKMTFEKKASDLHLKVGVPPILRIDGRLVPIETEKRTIQEDVLAIALGIMNPAQKAKFLERKELDMAYAVPGMGRFRVNVFQQRGSVGMVFRMVPGKILTFEDLMLPSVLQKIGSEQRGLILVTGTTGSGKSTTLAALIDHINTTRTANIVTIEDPIEFLHRDKKSIVNQREIGSDTFTFSDALRSALRQDPDVILVGEMRDFETISIALTAAETGHLVLSTLHTVDAAETINRIISVFPPYQQKQVRMQVAAVSQRDHFPAPRCQGRRQRPRAGGRGDARHAVGARGHHR